MTIEPPPPNFAASVIMQIVKARERELTNPQSLAWRAMRDSNPIDDSDRTFKLNFLLKGMSHKDFTLAQLRTVIATLQAEVKTHDGPFYFFFSFFFYFSFTQCHLYQEMNLKRELLYLYKEFLRTKHLLGEQ
jgi:hypothetical protein